MATTLYASLAANWDAAIATGVTQAVQTAIQANAIQLTAGITLWLILSGVATMFSKMTMQEWVFGAVRAVCLGILLTVAGFSTWIQTPLMQTIPDWIAHNVNGGFGAQTGPQQFDALRDTIVRQEAAILQQASGWSPTDGVHQIKAGFATWCICLALTVSFGIWEMARGMMGIIVATAPFLLFFYLFKTTQHVVLNLAGIALSLLVLDLMLATLLSISVTADTTFMQQAFATGGGGVEVQLDAMMNVFLFFLFGMVMTVLAPTIAAFLARGFLPGGGSAVSAPMNAMERAGRDMSSAAKSLNRSFDKWRSK